MIIFIFENGLEWWTCVVHRLKRKGLRECGWDAGWDTFPILSWSTTRIIIQHVFLTNLIHLNLNVIMPRQLEQNQWTFKSINVIHNNADQSSQVNQEHYGTEFGMHSPCPIGYTYRQHASFFMQAITMTSIVGSSY